MVGWFIKTFTFWWTSPFEHTNKNTLLLIPSLLIFDQIFLRKVEVLRYGMNTEMSINTDRSVLSLISVGKRKEIHGVERTRSQKLYNWLILRSIFEFNQRDLKIRISTFKERFSTLVSFFVQNDVLLVLPG